MKMILFCATLLFLLSCDKFLDKKAESVLVIPNSLPALQALLDNNNIMNIYLIIIILLISY